MKILEVCKVVPANSPSQFSLPFTFFDMPWLSLDPTSRLFFYEFPEPNIDFSKTLLFKLKNSLSLTLQHYLPIAGHLTWPQDSNSPVVQYNPGDSVSLTVAETEADFHSLSTDDFRKSVELRSLLPEFPISETQSPVMTLKITLFPTIGFSVGYMAHHAVLDGKSVSLFLHSWAYVCKNGDESVLPPHLTPSFNRSFVEHQTELEQAYPKGYGINNNLEKKILTVYDMSPPLDTMLGTFKLTREIIDKLRNSVLTYREEKNKLHGVTRISSFTIASAYMMVCLIKAREITAEKTFLGINVDARARLDPPLPSTYFGNCLIGCGNGRETKDLLLENYGFPNAVEVVSEALASINEGVVKLAGKLEGLVYSIFREYAGFMIAGSTRFELYKVDFGWGKPRKVEMVSIDKTDAFCLTDDRNHDGGIEIGIGLKKHQAETFASIFASGLVTC